MRALTTIIFLFAITSIAQAQITMGAHAGYTVAWMDYGDIELPEDAVIHIHGFNTAVSINYRISDRLSLLTEPGVTRRGAACFPGWNAGPGLPIFRGDSRWLLDYIELPILAQGHFAFREGRWEAAPSLGYSVSMLAAAKEEIINLDTKVVVRSSSMAIGGWGSLPRFDHGAKGGLRLARNFDEYQVYVKASMYSAFSNVDQSNTSRNRALDFSLGFLHQL